MKLSTFAVLFISGVALLGAGVANADNAKRDQEIDEKFKAADKNSDGHLTLEEAKAGMPRVARAFSKIDSANKGYVTADEIKARANN